MNKYLLVAYLQVLDVLTTLAFMQKGVAEANPISVWVMHLTSWPGTTLLAFKMILLSGLYYKFRNRPNEAKKITYFLVTFYGFIVVWNLLALLNT